jgi:ABC-2 type transport system permease protein
MFGKIAAFEFRYHLTSPVFWVTSLIFFLLTFGATASDNVHIGSGGNVLVNASFAIAQTLMIMSVFAIFITTAFVANVIVRDDETGFGPMVHATRMSKFDYLFGRFTGAFGVGCFAFLSVPLGMMIGAAMPWVDPETVGPFRLGDYAYAYFVLCVPTLFVMSAGFFALATATRSMLATYVGVIAFLMLYFMAIGYLSRPEFVHAAALIDPFGIGAVQLAGRYWTAIERNTQIPSLTGYLLWNRLLWVGAAFSLLGVAWAAFSTERKPGRIRKPKREAKHAVATPRYDRNSAWAQLSALTRFDMVAALRSPAFFVLLGLGFVNAIGSLWYANDLYGTTVYPVTRVMIQALAGSFSIIPLIIAIYYAGELVWRDRERRMHEIVGATPAPDWAFVVPKILAISLVLLLTIAVSVLAAVAVQALKGYSQFEIGRYVLWYVLPWTVDIVVTAVLAVFIQTLVPHKFAGWLAMLLVVVAQVTLTKLGLEHNLYQYGSSSAVPLSDMNGQGQFAQHAAWFRAYWSACALVLAVLAYAFWPRGVTAPLAVRVRQLPSRLRGVPGLIAVSGLAAMGGLGGFIYYNTNVLNEYRTKLDDERWAADYEKTLLAFETVPQPRIADVRMNVAIYPHESRVVTEGTYVVENRTDAALPVVHVRWARDLAVPRLAVQGAHLTKDYPQFQYRIFTFDRPMAPGERRTVTFSTVREQRGFRNSGNDTRVVDNGTFVDSSEISVGLGMGRDSLLQDRAKRRKYGLPPEMRPAKLEDPSARAFQYTRRDSDWVNTDLTVSTVADQMPIAPGYKLAESVADGRRTVRYKTDAPILDMFSVQSAVYTVKRDRWKDVELAVYFDPAHPYNVDRMIAGMKSSLDYFTANFSPFQFHQLRILEFPDYAQFAQSFANTIPYSEGLGFIANYADPEKIDMVTYVTAHEVAHQWWAHQVIGADMQGMTFLSETMAQYSALMVMEQLYGPEQIRKFLKFELDSYLRNRGGEVVEELPLERVENQPYIHYRKGSLAMYLLKDQVGSEAINRALRSMLKEYAFQGPPYPTSRDLIRHLREEVGPEHQQLITDLFEKITLYDAKVTSAKSTKRADGQWDVTLDVEARKLYADGKGRETETPLDEAFDIGVFTAEPGKKDYSRASILAMRPFKLHSGMQKISLVVGQQPKFAGVDPYNKRVDRNSDDNVTSVDNG